jgi:hypothetical protein
VQRDTTSDGTLALGHSRSELQGFGRVRLVAQDPGFSVRLRGFDSRTRYQQTEAIVELTLRWRKPAARIGRHRNPSPENICFVNSVVRVPACLVGSRGFESRTRRQCMGTLAEFGLAAAVLKTEGSAMGVWVRVPRSPPIPCLVSSMDSERRFTKPRVACSSHARDANSRVCGREADCSCL